MTGHYIKPDIYEENDFSEKVGDYKFNEERNMENFNLGKSIWLRFVRGAIYGAISTGITITFVGENTFTDLKTFIATLSVALIVGAISGALLAVDKFIRAE